MKTLPKYIIGAALAAFTLLCIAGYEPGQSDFGMNAGQVYMSSGGNGMVATNLPSIYLKMVNVLATNQAQTITAAQSGSYFNDAAAPVNHTNTLPAAAAGLYYSFFQTTTRTNSVKCKTGSDTIYGGITSTAAGGEIITTNKGVCIELYSPASGFWFLTTPTNGLVWH